MVVVDVVMGCSGGVPGTQAPPPPPTPLALSPLANVVPNPGVIDVIVAVVVSCAPAAFRAGVVLTVMEHVPGVVPVADGVDTVISCIIGK